MQGHS